MKVLSLFDGMAGTRTALDSLGIHVSEYHAFEIDKWAIKIAKKNWPDIIHHGDVKGAVEIMEGEQIDLLIGGFPCQNLSCAGDRTGLNGEKSSLFWEYVKCLRELKPKYFLLENVASMSKDSKAEITEAMGVEPIMINSALLTAQSRKRVYWHNLPGVKQPEDKGILLKDIIESGAVDRDKSYCIGASYCNGIGLENYLKRKDHQIVFDKPIRLGNVGHSTSQGYRVYSVDGKSVCLSALAGGMGAKTGLYLIKLSKTGKVKRDQTKASCLTAGGYSGGNHSDMDLLGITQDGDTPIVRRLSPVECERLQGYEDGFTEGVSNTQRYRMLGNSFTVPVIAHILKDITALNQSSNQ